MSHTEVLSFERSLQFLKDGPNAITEEVFLSILESLTFYIQDPSTSLIDTEKIAQILQYLGEVTLNLFHEVDDLKKAQDDLKKAYDALESRNRKLEISVEDLKACNRKLEISVEDLKACNRKLEISVEDLKACNLKLEIPLLTGQLAYRVERELVKRILMGTGVNTYCTLNMIDRAIHSRYSLMSRDVFASEEQRAKATTNSCLLADSLGLTHETYSIINALKSTRNDTAHPNLTLEDLLSCLETVAISPKLLEKSEKLIQVLRKLNVSRINTNED